MGGKKIVFAASLVGATIKLIKDISKNNRNQIDPEVYFECQTNSSRPVKINLRPYKFSEMASRMASMGKSCITAEYIDAKNVISSAVPAYPIFAEYKGVHHFHACDIYHENYNEAKSYDKNPRLEINGNTLHSFWVI